jgi:hypothetical protein
MQSCRRTRVSSLFQGCLADTCVRLLCGSVQDSEHSCWLGSATAAVAVPGYLLLGARWAIFAAMSRCARMCVRGNEGRSDHQTMFIGCCLVATLLQPTSQTMKDAALLRPPDNAPLLSVVMGRLLVCCCTLTFAHRCDYCGCC